MKLSILTLRISFKKYFENLFVKFSFKFFIRKNFTLTKVTWKSVNDSHTNTITIPFICVDAFPGIFISEWFSFFCLCWYPRLCRISKCFVFQRFSFLRKNMSKLTRNEGGANQKFMKVFYTAEKLFDLIFNQKYFKVNQSKIIKNSKISFLHI